MDVFATLLTSAGLGAGAGVNAYATLLVFGGFARWQPALFHGEVAQFFASTPVLIVLGLLYAVEFAADKVPVVDHVWDVIHTFVRPVAGAVVAWGAASHSVPHGLLILAAVLGGGNALATHAMKATLRAASTVTTGGAASPILSLFEDLFAFINALLAILLPWIVLATIILVTIFFFRLRKRMSARRQDL